MRAQAAAALIAAAAPVPAGRFLMGSLDGAADERPVHRVRVDAFAMALTPVTNAQYAAFLAAAGPTEPPWWRNPRFNHPEQPVVGVTWDEAMAYCDWLSARTGRRVRLPTEAERERAARGGLEGQRFPWGDADPVWEGPHALGSGRAGAPLVVGSTPPNPYGLYHLADNVHEWCLDYYQADYYAHSPIDNPLGPAAGARRASRGGSWRHHVKVTRCAARSSLPPANRFSDYGFRWVVVEEPGGKART